MKLIPPFQYKGLIVYSVEGLFHYLKYYYDLAIESSHVSYLSAKMRVQREEREYKRKIRELEKEVNRWKKKYNLLKSKHRTKYDVYNTPSGIKVLVPITNPKGERSPLEALETIKQAIQNRQFNLDRWRSEDRVIKQWRDLELIINKTNR